MVISMNMVIKNGRVYSIKKRKYEIRDLQISNGKIAGSHIPGKEIDLKGAWVYPGMVDAHAHFLGTGQKKMIVNLERVSSIEEFKIIFKDKKGLIRGRGWDQEKLGFFPTRDLLDKLTDSPAILTRRCGHVAVVNTKAIEAFNLKDLDGMDDTSIMDGLLRERALEKLNKRILTGSEEIQKASGLAMTEFLKYGITSVHTDDYHSCDLHELVEILSKQKTIRLFEKICVEKPEELEQFRDLMIFNNEYFQAGAAKIYLDGSLGARTAAMLEDYADDPGNRGILYMNRFELRKFVEIAEKKGIQLAVHVIGDRALEEALESFSVIRKSNPLKHRLIHVQVINDSQLKKIINLGLEIDIQPVFYDSDRDIALSRLGDNRIKLSYRFDDMYRAGVKMALSTDAPVENVNPFENIRVAERFFDRKVAFEFYSKAGRRQSFNEQQLELLQGEQADFFVLEKDLFAISADELPTLKSKMTFVGGELVYSD